MILMRLYRCRALLLAATVMLAACGSTPPDETANWSAEKLYAEAKDEQAAGNYERAARLFERLEGRAAGTPLAQQAQIERAFVLYKTGEKAQALSVLDRFIKLHPSSPGLDYAMYLHGLVNFNDNLGVLSSLSRQDLSERDQQAARDAFQSFKQLVDQFPNSVYADDARQRMNYIVNSLAAYEVHVARYYFRRLRGRREPRAAGSTGVPDHAVGRGGDVHHGPELRPARARAAARRRGARAGEELPRQPLRLAGPDHAPARLVAVLVTAQPAATSLASDSSHASACASSATRVIGGSASRRRRP